MQRHEPSAKRATTSGKTNEKSNKIKRTKPINNILTKGQPHVQNQPTITNSPNKSAATDPATTNNALRSTRHTDLHNRQDRTTTKVMPTGTTKR